MNTNELLDLMSAGPRDVDRRDALLKAGKAGLQIVLAALPLGLAAGCAGIGKLVANDPKRAADVLNFALLLERRESEFYKIGLETPGLVPASDRAVIEQIGRNETRHVVFLTTGITGIGGVPDTSTQFDHTGAGKVPDVFRNYRSFLKLAQTNEETGVRAYKGQAPFLMDSPTLLTAALRIHSSEGRHVALLRHLRGLKGWISESQDTGYSPITYQGESNVTHGGVNLSSVSKISHRALTEAFDEPLTRAQVMAVVSPFIRKAA
ncbi:MAG: ferritin-like domain-containing protein [Chthoniobacterales bacterium]|nr:ferritin-like domain-containing protein [Chthoniobacterales bacterium]